MYTICKIESYCSNKKENMDPQACKVIEINDLLEANDVEYLLKEIVRETENMLICEE